MKSKTSRFRILSISLMCSLLLVTIPVHSALAGTCDDGDAGPNTITCSADPSAPADTNIGLDLDDDIYVQNAGVTTTLILGDGDASGGQTTGDGGDDQITMNGNATKIYGDRVNGDGGDDDITVNGTVTASVAGDDNVNGNGGDDRIKINGTTGTVYGDGTSLGDGGDDEIIVNGTVTGDVEGDHVSGGAGGNDSVILGVNAVVGGTIDGEGGTDTLAFDALTQAQVNALGLNPAGDNATINGHTYTWLNFESLLGLLAELVEEAGRSLRVFFASDSLAAVESTDGDGINFFAGPGRIAFISFDSLDSIAVGGSANYNTPNSAGWYVTVANLGADPDHGGRTLFQVSVYNSGGGLYAQFTFSN